MKYGADQWEMVSDQSDLFLWLDHVPDEVDMKQIMYSDFSKCFHMFYRLFSQLN